MDRLIAELEDKNFKVRDRAEKQLRALDEAIRPPLLRKLKGKLSAEFRHRAERLLAHLERPPDTERLQLLRGVEVLEYLGTAPARQVLEQMAAGMAGSVITEEGRGLDPDTEAKLSGGFPESPGSAYLIDASTLETAWFT